MLSLKAVALLSPLFVCGIFSLLNFSAHWSNDRPKVIIKYLMMTGFLFTMVIVLNQTENHYLFSLVVPVFYSCLLLLVPLYFLYVKTLTTLSISNRKIWYHFIPAFIYLIVPYFFLFLLSNETRIDYFVAIYKGYTNFTGLEYFLFILFIINKYLFAAQVVLYFFINRRLLNQNKKTINEIFSKIESVKLDWLSTLNYAFIFGGVNGAIINLIPTSTVNHEGYYLSISLLLFAIFFLIMGLLSNSQLPIIQVIEANDKVCNSQNENVVLSPLMQDIHKYVIKEQFFKNPNLTIWEISKSLGTNRTYISKSINQETGMNFNSYINKIRIEEAIKLMSDETCKKDILSISLTCGFSSTSSFYRHFKAITGQKPSEYIKSH
jgi:AraC-like DNA-binding protein